MSIGLPEPAISNAYVKTYFYNLETERQEGEKLMSMLNMEQRTIFDVIIRAIQDVDEALPTNFTRWQNTAHSRFKLPVPILDNSSCGVRHNTKEGQSLKAAKIIIWYECTMTLHHAWRAVDRFFRGIVGLDIPFGSKNFVLGGDWRPISPVSIHANRTSIEETCLKNSPLEFIQAIFTH
ncbi:ATP-dependent DNA helicase [Trichonephila clavipes]|nr:ATP-dependent DNA helicase [Trichonephila clavipes]